eukprot:scaffold472_cov18-Tisochrysis_lutea.AAC.1
MQAWYCPTLTMTALIPVDENLPFPPCDLLTGVTGLASHLVWQIRTVDLNNGRDCMDTFISNKWAGGILFAGCVGGRLLST